MSEGVSRQILIASGNESQWAQTLARQLSVFGYEVGLERHERVGRRAAKEDLSAIVWDLTPPAEAAFRSLAELRTLAYYPPVLAVASDLEPTQALMALKYGCDQVLSRPETDVFPEGWVLFLEGSIEAAIRRRGMEHSHASRREFGIRVGDLEIDARRCVVRTQNRIIDLTHRELNLLLQLAETPGVVRSKQQLLESVWGSNDESLLTSLTTHINRLRMKIETDLKNPQYIVGIWGVGYMLVSSPEGNSDRAQHGRFSRKI